MIVTDDVTGRWKFAADEIVAEHQRGIERRFQTKDRPKKNKPHGSRTRSADRTRKSKPYHGYKNLVGSETTATTTVYREGRTTYRSTIVRDKIQGGKPNHAARAVPIDAAFSGAQAVQSKHTREAFGFLKEYFERKRREKEATLAAIQIAKDAEHAGLTVEEYLERANAIHDNYDPTEVRQ